MKPINEKTVITVSRKWNNPRIKTSITNEEISLEMNIADFEQALAEEIGSITFTLTKKQFRLKLKQAIEKVLYGIKEESIKVVE